MTPFTLFDIGPYTNVDDEYVHMYIQFIKDSNTNGNLIAPL